MIRHSRQSMTTTLYYYLCWICPHLHQWSYGRTLHSQNPAVIDLDRWLGLHCSPQLFQCQIFICSEGYFFFAAIFNKSYLLQAMQLLLQLFHCEDLSLKGITLVTKIYPGLFEYLEAFSTIGVPVATKNSLEQQDMTHAKMQLAVSAEISEEKSGTIMKEVTKSKWAVTKRKVYGPCWRPNKAPYFTKTRQKVPDATSSCFFFSKY